MESIKWENKAQELFKKIIDNLPQFHRTIAEKLVKESAEEIAQGKNLEEVGERELMEAFFKEVPPAFKGMMKRLFSRLHLDYSKYIDEEGD